MKRLPVVVSVVAVAALSASLAYWGVQLFQPAQRPIAAAPPQSKPPASIDAAAALFGGKAQAAVAASNYQLKGVVASGSGVSVAILSVDGKPAQALPVGAEVAPGVTVQAVRPTYVMLAEGGTVQRLELPASSASPSLASSSSSSSSSSSKGGSDAGPGFAPMALLPPALTQPPPPGAQNGNGASPAAAPH